MPLPPLTDDSSLWTLTWRILLIIPVLLFLFISLLFFNLVQMLSLLLMPVSRPASLRLNRWCANIWWGWCVIACQRFNGLRIIVTGDDVPVAENALLISNHQQMPDIMALMMLARTKDRLGDLKFFVKEAFKWVPGMGWGMQLLGFPFLKRDWAADKKRIRRTFATLVKGRIPVWLVSYAEGTRLTRDKLRANMEWAKSKGLEPTRHVMIPRTKGFVATVDGMRDHVRALYDITIGYEVGVPSLWQLMSGRFKRIHVDVRRFVIDELPTSDDDLKEWLFERFYEKDDRLDRFYRTGSMEAV
jgi:1-acyl-sn-glycerol-3-phosphate acyltransferase